MIQPPPHPSVAGGIDGRSAYTTVNFHLFFRQLGSHYDIAISLPNVIEPETSETSSSFLLINAVALLLKQLYREEGNLATEPFETRKTKNGGRWETWSQFSSLLQILRTFLKSLLKQSKYQTLEC